MLNTLPECSLSVGLSLSMMFAWSSMLMNGTCERLCEARSDSADTPRSPIRERSSPLSLNQGSF